MDVNSVLKEASGRSGSGLRHNRIRSILVTAEMALAVILLVGAALLIRPSLDCESAPPGFDPHNVITMQTSLTGGRYDSTDKVDRIGPPVSPTHRSAARRRVGRGVDHAAGGSAGGLAVPD